MIYVFDTLDYGRVEIDTDENAAYFAVRDEIYEIDPHTRSFRDFNGTEFHFLPPVPYTQCKDAILRVWEPRTIGRDTRTVARPGVQRPEVRQSEAGGSGGGSQEPPAANPEPSRE